MSVREQLIEMLNPILGADYGPAVIGGIVDMMISRGVTINRWILVSERLPEPRKKVLCCGVKGGIFISELHKSKLGGRIVGRRSACSNVICWMPLPSTEGLE